MKKQLFSRLLIFALAAAIFSGVFVNADNAPESGDLKLAYRLDFEQENELGKNTAGTEYPDATVHNTGLISQVDAKSGENRKGIFINAESTSFKNYLELPTSVFDGQSKATIAGWFYHPSGAAAYLGEIGIFSPENNKAFRSDQFASFHSGCYLWVFGNNQAFNSMIYPVYDAWYHMAYVIDGQNITVYLNGAQAGSFSANWDSISDLHSATSHFYLGQSAYETNHPDFNGGFDDFRIYQSALTAEQIASEYDFALFDFMVDEYTFDSSEGMYKDNVRGYDLQAFPNGYTAMNTTNAPAFDDGAMYLDGNSAAMAAKNNEGTLNPVYFLGADEVTFSLDFKIGESETCQWTRFFDIFVDGQELSFMSYQGSWNSSFDIVYRNRAGDSLIWILGSQGKQFTFERGVWYNAVLTIKEGNFTVYIDGEEVVSVLSGDICKLTAVTNQFDQKNSFFTIGGPVYEGARMINAHIDNFRVFDKFASAEDAEKIASGERSRAHVYSVLTLVDGENRSEITRKTKEEYTLPVPVRDGYIFKCWKDDAGAPYTVITKNTGDLTLHAEWEESSNTVTFEPNGGRGEMNDFYVTANSSVLPECSYAKTGYVFIGWALSENGEKAFENGADVSVITEDITLYAVWQAKVYTVTFDSNGGDGQMASIECVFDRLFTLPECTFTKDGYNFIGWTVTGMGLPEFEDKEELMGIREGNDITLYASWIENEYTVSFYANGGSGEMSEISAHPFEYVTVPKNTFAREGYRFEGWSYSRDGEKDISDGESVIFENDTVLYAVWSRDNGGGEVNTGDFVVITIVTLMFLSAIIAFAIIYKRRRASAE